MLISAAAEETRVLLVEDRASDAELIRFFLEENDCESFRVVHAHNISTGLSLLRQQNFQAVMLDLLLPDTHDLDGLASLRAMTPTMPVLILTGREDENLAATAIENGAQDYLLKEKINSRMLRRSIRHAIRRKRFDDMIARRAYFDPLTELPNREMLYERLRVALARQHRASQGLGVMLLDLNGFKDINDTHGHAAGDFVLKETARRILCCLRPYDLAARLGGDEFVVLIEDAKDTIDYGAVAEKLIKTIAMPLQLGKQNIAVGVSIGIALCHEDATISANDILHQADQAMYKAKLTRSNGYCVFSRNNHSDVNSCPSAHDSGEEKTRPMPKFLPHRF